MAQHALRPTPLAPALPAAAQLVRTHAARSTRTACPACARSPPHVARRVPLLLATTVTAPPRCAARCERSAAGCLGRARAGAWCVAAGVRVQRTQPRSLRFPPARAQTLATVLLACGLALVLLQLLRSAPGTSPASGGGGVGGGDAGVCVAWRATVCGSQYSARKPLEDLPCTAVIRPSEKRVSGAPRAAAARLAVLPAACVRRRARPSDSLESRKPPQWGVCDTIRAVHCASAAPHVPHRHGWQGTASARTSGCTRRRWRCCAARDCTRSGSEARRGAPACAERSADAPIACALCSAHVALHVRGGVRGQVAAARGVAAGGPAEGVRRAAGGGDAAGRAQLVRRRAAAARRAPGGCGARAVAQHRRGVSGACAATHFATRCLC